MKAASFLVASVAAQNVWNPVVSPSLSAVTEALAVNFADDGLTGFMGAGSNGVGSQILKTIDGGVTWNAVWPTPDTKNPANLFLGGAVKSRTQAVITGVLNQEYSTDGTLFNASSNDFVTPAQDAGVEPDGDFGMVIASAKANGFASSKTGNVWTNFDLGTNSSLYLARYGSWPIQTVWYATAGLFPTGNTGLVPHTSKFGRTKDGNIQWTYESVESTPPVNCSEDTTNCFSAGIFKTTDSGKTFTQIYDNINQGDNIYPNDIDCYDANNCVAVLEGDTCRIINTVDGGKTWTESMRDTDSACSLIYVDMISNSEIWIAGGHLSALNFEGRFWHSTDGAKTWVKEAHKGIYVLDLDMNTLYGYALAINASGAGITLLKKT